MLRRAASWAVALSSFTSLMIGCAWLAGLGDKPLPELRNDGGAGDAAALDMPAPDALAPDSSAGGPWACVGSVTWPDASWPAATAQALTVTQPYYNFITGDPLPGISAVPCSRVDPTCANPLSAPRLTDDAGVVSFPLYYAFNGYFLSLWDASLPMMLYINPPASTPAPQVVGAMVSIDSMQQIYDYVIAGLTGAPRTFDPTRGHVMVAAYDCNGQPAPGVTVSVSHTDPQTVQTYFASGLPNASATETDATGFFVAVNVPTGAQTLTMTLATTGKLLASASIYVVAGDISQINLPPSPL